MQIKAKNRQIEVILYEDIGGWFGISANDFIREVKDAAKDATEINLRINSNGGNVFDGIAIYNYLKSAKQKIIVNIDGLAASIASIIAQAADSDELHMADNGWIMIHDPWIMAIGTSAELRKTADTMDGIRETLLDTYMTRATKARDDISTMMTEETWLNAEDAKAAGLVDGVTESLKVAASVHKDWFKHPPKSLVADAPKKNTVKDYQTRMTLALRKIGVADRSSTH